MESPNIAHVPLNPEGALEMGMSPCEACNAGWGNYSMGTDGQARSESCRDNCEYWKRYVDRPLAQKAKEIAEKCGSKKS